MGPESIRNEDRGSFVLTEFSGEFSVEAGRFCVDQMVDGCLQYGRSKVLLDCRQLMGRMPLFDRFQVTEYAASKKLQLRQVALLARPDMLLPDRFVENVAVNRGMTLKIFVDFDEAVQWLTQELSARDATPDVS